MTRLLLVEGLPGTGKTTFSSKIFDYISKSKEAYLYQEGDAHPADFAWCACIPQEEVAQIIKRFPEYQKPMEEVMYFEDGYAIIPYIKIPIKDQDFYHLMESYEVYDNRVGFEKFKKLNLKRWTRFAEKALKEEGIHIFECAFLQNHITELLLFHCMEAEDIQAYLLDLIEPVLPLEPVLLYLSQASVQEGLKKISEIRVNDLGEKIWMERVLEYIEESPYGKAHQLKGFDGFVEFFQRRKNIEESVLSRLPIQVYKIDNPDKDYEIAWQKIQTIVKNHF
jgi:hypothetical protein